MKIREFFEQRRARLEAAEYDPRVHRREITQSIVQHLVTQGLEVRSVQLEREGPLGGESDGIRIVADTPIGDQGFIIAVYANGVYSRSQEEKYS